MKRVGKGSEATIAEIMSGLEAGDDPRRAMVRVNKEIVDYQRAGEPVPPGLLRLSQRIATECASQSQGR